jgi:hypothetical protein
VLTGALENGQGKGTRRWLQYPEASLGLVRPRRLVQFLAQPRESEADDVVVVIKIATTELVFQAKEVGAE